MHATMILRTWERSNTIGFIGLGNKFSNLLQLLHSGQIKQLDNLVKKSLPNEQDRRKIFVVYDVNQSAMSRALAQHATSSAGVEIRSSNSPKELAKMASTIISMVPNSKDVHDVYLGSDGVMSALKETEASSVFETLCLDQSTIEQKASKSIASLIRAIGAEMMDAPVSGGVVGAGDGTLAIMTGGSEAAFAKSLQLLSPMAKKVTHCGDLGAGLAAKIAQVLEAMLLGQNPGPETQVLAEIINNSTGRCWSSEINNPCPSVLVGTSSPPAHREYVGGFVTKLAHKDLSLATQAASECGSPLELGRLVERIYRPLAHSEKWGNMDFSVIYKYLSEARAEMN